MLEGVRIPEALGEHEIVGLIGQGGMGYILEVRARSTGVRYAAKLMKRGAPVAKERFKREAELLARCDRFPGIVKVHSAGETPDGMLYMIMDLVAGESLEKAIEREGRFAPERAARLTAAVARALGHAHKLGIVHRDVKPSNILIDADGPRVADFGLATAVDVETLTKTGAFLGTPRYIAPEQAHGATDVGPPADVFSLGCVLFELLAGRPPLADAPNVVSCLHSLGSPEPIADVRDFEPSCPEPLARIVARALEKDPARRHADGAELTEDLGRFLAGKAILPASSGASPAWRRRLRRVGPVAAFVLVSALLLAVVVAAVTSGRARALSTEAREAVARATELGRAQKAGAKDTGEALAAACGAYARTLACRAANAPDAEALVADASAALLSAATLAAERDARGLVDRLDTIPGAPGSLPAAVRLLRGRTLLALGQLEGLEAETAALEGVTADALELLGDVKLARGDLPAAQSAYARALGAAPRPELRAKRGIAAARAGDDATALGDLAALVPDLGTLDKGRKANERLEAFAPALYRRALASGSDPDLEAAWRLAPPPPEVAHAAGARWLALAEEQMKRLTEGLQLSASYEKMLSACVPLGLYARAREADPECEPRELWPFLEQLPNWGRSWASGAERRRVAREYVNALPDEPFLYLVAAGNRVDTAAESEQAIGSCRAGIDRLRPLRKGDPPLVERTALDLGIFLARAEGRWRLEPDEDRFRRVARATGVESDAWQLLGEYYASRDMYGEALDALGHVPATVPNEPLPRLENAARLRIRVLMSARQLEEAVALVAKLPPALRENMKPEILGRCSAWEQGVQAEPADAEKGELVLLAGKGYVLMGELAAAERVLAALRSQGDPRADELAPLVEKARSAPPAHE
jgi:tetratricopeptide (TPR) repeat protein